MQSDDIVPRLPRISSRPKECPLNASCRVRILFATSQCTMVECPICGKGVVQSNINAHIDSGCEKHHEGASPEASTAPTLTDNKTPKNGKFASFFQRSQASTSKSFDGGFDDSGQERSHVERPYPATQAIPGKSPAFDHVARVKKPSVKTTSPLGVKREREDGEDSDTSTSAAPPPAKRPRNDAIAAAAPLAERMRPRTLDDVHGQELVGPNGLLRALIETNRVPSLILWGGPGTGKTTIARLIAQTANSRFVEINSTSSGVGECKKLFVEARNELALSGRKTIVFCDEIHRFSKSQQDVFLAPVEAGSVILIGATTENPSFKVINALMSRCRTFTLTPLSESDIQQILRRVLERVAADTEPPTPVPALVDDTLLTYLATASVGDARTALNLLSLSLSLTSTQPSLTLTELKKALTTTLLHDRTGDSHYNYISALQKSIRGSCADAALYYLARMLTAGEDPLYISRRLLVIASEDVGLADNSMLSLAVATYTAVEKVGLPEARINLAHCVTALALSPKSVRAYRGYSAAEAAVKKAGGGAAQVPLHLRNAPTRLLREMGCGKEYKYNPMYLDGKVKQEYLPEELAGQVFLGDRDLGERVDEELADGDDPVEADELVHGSSHKDLDVQDLPAQAVDPELPKKRTGRPEEGQSSVWEPGGDIEIDEWEA